VIKATQLAYNQNNDYVIKIYIWQPITVQKL